jgi:hypothetical protein
MAFRVPRSISSSPSEVTSQAAYERSYRHVLEYPGEQSGPTGGIGYDFGTQTRAQISADWGDKVDAGMLRILLGASGKRGDAAAAYSRATRGQVDIPWDVALDVFRQPRPAALSRHPRALLSRREARLGPDCKGVLFSIAFNRDAAASSRAGRAMPRCARSAPASRAAISPAFPA